MEPTSVDALNALLKSIAVERELTNNHLMALMHLYTSSQQGDLSSPHASVMGALRLLDMPDSVQKVVARKSRRSFYKVKDLGSDYMWTCRPSQRHCNCDQFIQVIMSGILTCPHVLAARLSEALGTLQEICISDVAFAEHS